jgi:hypothetical protein
MADRIASISPKLAIAAAIAMAGWLGACSTQPIVGADYGGNSAHERSADAAPAAPVIVHIPKKGDVLIAGGGNAKLQSLATAEFFDQATRKFFTTCSMATSRAGMGAIALKGAAFVLVPGGVAGSATLTQTSLTLKATVLDGAQVYGAASGKFVPQGDLLQARVFHTGTLLGDGTVLITGGFDPFGTPLRSAELYHPTTHRFGPTAGEMTVARAVHSATLLKNGTVLIAGGIETASGETTQTAEIYNPATGRFTATSGLMPVSAQGHSATLIVGCACALEGQVLIAGGAESFVYKGMSYIPLAEVMLFDPATGQFNSLVKGLTDTRWMHSASLLPKGKVLLAGGAYGEFSDNKNKFNGFSGEAVWNTAEIFDPATKTLACVGGRVNGTAPPS